MSASSSSGRGSSSSGRESSPGGQESSSSGRGSFASEPPRGGAPSSGGKFVLFGGRRYKPISDTRHRNSGAYYDPPAAGPRSVSRRFVAFVIALMLLLGACLPTLLAWQQASFASPTRAVAPPVRGQAEQSVSKGKAERGTPLVFSPAQQAFLRYKRSQKFLAMARAASAPPHKPPVSQPSDEPAIERERRKSRAFADMAALAAGRGVSNAVAPRALVASAPPQQPPVLPPRNRRGATAQSVFEGTPLVFSPARHAYLRYKRSLKFPAMARAASAPPQQPPVSQPSDEPAIERERRKSRAFAGMAALAAGSGVSKAVAPGARAVAKQFLAAALAVTRGVPIALSKVPGSAAVVVCSIIVLRLLFLLFKQRIVIKRLVVLGWKLVASLNNTNEEYKEIIRQIQETLGNSNKWLRLLLDALKAHIERIRAYKRNAQRDERNISEALQRLFTTLNIALNKPELGTTADGARVPITQAIDQITKEVKEGLVGRLTQDQLDVLQLLRSHPKMLDKVEDLYTHFETNKSDIHIHSLPPGLRDILQGFRGSIPASPDAPPAGET
jgi:hypothetical protein